MKKKDLEDLCEELLLIVQDLSFESRKDLLARAQEQGQELCVRYCGPDGDYWDLSVVRESDDNHVPSRTQYITERYLVERLGGTCFSDPESILNWLKENTDELAKLKQLIIENELRWKKITTGLVAEIARLKGVTE